MTQRTGPTEVPAPAPAPAPAHRHRHTGTGTPVKFEALPLGPEPLLRRLRNDSSIVLYMVLYISLGLSMLYLGLDLGPRGRCVLAAPASWVLRGSLPIIWSSSNLEFLIINTMSISESSTKTCECQILSKFREAKIDEFVA
jgi:hypothetical protein